MGTHIFIVAKIDQGSATNHQFIESSFIDSAVEGYAKINEVSRSKVKAVAMGNIEKGNIVPLENQHVTTDQLTELRKELSVQ